MRPFTRGQLAGLRQIRQAEAEAARVVREREAHEAALAAERDAELAEPECEVHGESKFWETCDRCGGEGFSHHDCGEDTCCCLNPEDNVPCDTCDGEGGWWVCHSCRKQARADAAR